MKSLVCILLFSLFGTVAFALTETPVDESAFRPAEKSEYIHADHELNWCSVYHSWIFKSHNFYGTHFAGVKFIPAVTWHQAKTMKKVDIEDLFMSVENYVCVPAPESTGHVATSLALGENGSRVTIYSYWGAGAGAIMPYGNIAGYCDPTYPGYFRNIYNGNLFLWQACYHFQGKLVHTALIPSSGPHVEAVLKADHANEDMAEGAEK